MDKSHQLVLELLSLPDNILINIIFPDLPVETLNKLCMLNVRFNNICNNDILWEIKTIKEYPFIVNNKSFNTSWKDFYFLSSKDAHFVGI